MEKPTTIESIIAAHRDLPGALLPVLHEIQQELASREHRLTEVRILDLLIWSRSAAT